VSAGWRAAISSHYDVRIGMLGLRRPRIQSLADISTAGKRRGVPQPTMHESIDMNSVGPCLGAEHIRASLKRLETGRNILHPPDLHRDHRKAGRAGRDLNLTHVPQGDRIAGIPQNR
jgi:hypothetical protein